MLVESHKKLSGNARFEGFAVDLAKELSVILGFNYTFKLVDDDKVRFTFSSEHLLFIFSSTAVKPLLVTGMGCLER